MAHAQWTVIDPWNLVQSINQFYSEHAQEMKQIKQHEVQLEHLKATFQQLKTVGAGSHSSHLSSINETLRIINDYREASERVYGAVGDQAKFLNTVKTLYGASNAAVSLDRFMQQEAQRARMGDNRAKSLMTTANTVFRTVEQAESRRRQLQGQARNALGQAEIGQTTNQYMDVVIAQNNALQVAIGEQLKLAGAREQREAAAGEAQAIQSEQVTRGLDQSREATRRWLEQNKKF